MEEFIIQTLNSLGLGVNGIMFSQKSFIEKIESLIKGCKCEIVNTDKDDTTILNINGKFNITFVNVHGGKRIKQVIVGKQ